MGSVPLSGAPSLPQLEDTEKGPPHTQNVVAPGSWTPSPQPCETHVCLFITHPAYGSPDGPRHTYTHTLFTHSVTESSRIMSNWAPGLHGRPRGHSPQWISACKRSP